MKKYTLVVLGSLFCCLFIYVFYRTEKTLVNQFVIALLSKDLYQTLKYDINHILPLNEYVIYSLPEGLWIFCITLTSASFYIAWNNHKYRLVSLPIILAMSMELFQLAGFTNGRFDIMDLIFSTAFWVLAVYISRHRLATEPLFQSFNPKCVSCLASYAIVYLAHVSW